MRHPRYAAVAVAVVAFIAIPLTLAITSAQSSPDGPVRPAASGPAKPGAEPEGSELPELGQISAHLLGRGLRSRAWRRSSGSGSAAVMVWAPAWIWMVR